jgi:tRNA-splicing ligase RtcB (3'-phosphate/5'-hydroxy nucleic acid ligase)
MFMLSGKYATAKIFTDNVEDTARSQIVNLLNQPFSQGANIRIMPDTHAGAGCVIGFTAKLTDKIIPNLIGVDIGCGMLVVDITGLKIDLNSIDNIIHDKVPAGHDINSDELTKFKLYETLLCHDHLKNQGNFGKALGSLGGGNHFIEINESNSGKHYLVIHSGSRNLGKQVAEFYQRMAIDLWKNGGTDHVAERRGIVDALRSIGKGYEIPDALAEHDKRFKAAHPQYPADLCFLFGQTMLDYWNDMEICQLYASINRTTMADTILTALGSRVQEHDFFETVHNYINSDDNIMRKGAVSANKGERLIIPINMRDGSLLCVGKGNEDWNNSAPHGAGRLMSRSEAKKKIAMHEYRSSMDGIYTSCVTEETLDESPMAYKPMQEIIDNIQPTVDITEIIKPIYNFKAGE